MNKIKALLFDKDGTLFDYQASWGQFHADFLGDLAGDDADLLVRLADATGFDLASTRFLADSPVIAGTLDTILDAVLTHMPHLDRQALLQDVIEGTAQAPQVPAVPLPPLLDGFLSSGLTLGIATNDSEAAALAHLTSAGIEAHFAFIAGYDSGFGSKPAPGMLEGFCDATDLRPNEVAMVGDSTHDLHAGKAAGMWRVGVLTGVATHADLAPHADIVLPDIGHIPAWLRA